MQDDGFDELDYCPYCFCKVPAGELEEVNSKWVCVKCATILLGLVAE